ncbi:sperm-associated antigen 4 protein-like [Xiphophorus couchianus]|uniref:sperm-associated antigen 4 protein-like n=1 Tax=Xiphophorus couchianus TaxID=32473 RepID=UPI00101624D2|nr:sperm-associated antigen 4 protein-like [Xiphophorus couchianus]
MKHILRRSVRLVLNGYYGADGKPTISYHETSIRKWTYRRYNHAATKETSSGNISCSSSSSSSCSNEDLLKFTLKRCFVSVIFLVLFYGFACIIAPLSMDPLVSSPPTINTVSVPGCEDKGRQIQEVKDVLIVLQNKMDYLLPSADLLPNFALKSQGAKVLQWRPLAAHPGQLQRCGWFGFALEEPFIHPDIVIQGRTHLNPGECWAFEGSQGHLAIALSHRVLISHVTLGHLPKMLSPTGNIWSAPKEFSVYGMREPEQEWTHLGTFIYEQDGDSLQTFELPLYTHNRLLEGAWKFAQPVYICFADLEKAFDCVPLGTLWEGVTYSLRWSSSQPSVKQPG